MYDQSVSPLRKPIPYEPRKNWIANGNMMVSNRGDFTSASSMTNGAFSLDRWRFGGTGVSATKQHLDTLQPAELIDSKSLKIASTSTASGYLVKYQRIEDYKLFQGQQVTYSAWVKSNNTNARLYAYDAVAILAEESGSSVHPGDGEWHKLVLTVTIPTNGSRLEVHVGIIGYPIPNTVSITTGDYFEFTGAKLEFGGDATPFIPQSLEQSYLECGTPDDTDDLGFARTVRPSIIVGSAPRKSWIINGDRIISQRQSYSSPVVFSGNGYFIDMYYGSIAGAGITGTVQRRALSTSEPGRYSTKLACTNTAGGGAYMTAHQRIEDYEILRGKTVTWSAWVKTNRSNWFKLRPSDGVTAPVKSNDIIGNETWQFLSHTFVVSTSATQLILTFGAHNSGADSGDYWELTNEKLEIGNQATPFEPRSYGEELSLAQRYFYNPCITTPTSAFIGKGTITDLTAGLHTAYVHVNLPVPMRTDPTVSYSSTSHFAMTASNYGTTTPISSIVYPGGSPSSVKTLRVYANSGLSGVGNVTDLICISSSGWMYFSAEF